MKKTKSNFIFQPKKCLDPSRTASLLQKSNFKLIEKVKGLNLRFFL